MTWNFWDVLIVLLALLNMGTLVALVLAVLKIKNGTVSWAMGRAKSLTTHAKTLAATGQTAFAANRARATELAAEFTGLRTTLHDNDFRTPFANQPISYAKVVGALATVRQVQNGLALFGSLRKGGLKAAVAHVRPKQGSAQRSFADRLGLVPPVMRKLGPVIRIAKTGLGVHRELRSRGLL